MTFLPDSFFLQRCIELARIPNSATEPNPRVGAVLVHDGRIIGEGYHTEFGGPHAEVEAIRSVSDASFLSQSTLYVSLEPCNHEGKTPACTDLILSSGIPRVVVGCEDPNPKVAGAGIARLREEGLEVHLAEDPAPFHALIRHFITNQVKSRPHIVLKWAQSPDGFMAAMDETGRLLPAPISGAESRRLTHRMRADLQAILVGRNTALVDDPALTTRAWPGPNPVRIVLDPELNLPGHLRIFRGAPLVRVNHKENRQSGNVIHYRPSNSDAFRDLRLLMESLYADLQIGSILVEGGPETLRQFLTQGLFDEIALITGERKLGRGLPAPSLPEGFAFDKRFPVGDDLWQYAGEFESPWM